VTKDIFIGIDGGGTKTKVRVEHSDGQLIGQAVSGPSNIRLSVDKAWQSIFHAISEVLNSADISLEDKNYRFHVGMGLAGCEVADIRNDFLNRPHPFTTLELNSDAHTACVGAHGGKEGAIIIVGTGAVGYQIQAGKGTKVSGWGFPHDDEGGGAWLGLEAVRLTFQWIDHRTERSPLVEDIFSYFNNNLEHFVSWSNRANSTEFAKLAPLVINHSQQEEIAAVRLMKKAAHAIDRVGVALAKTQTTPLRCSLFGGIAPFLEPWLSEELRETLVARESDANIGAVLMIREAVKKPSRNAQKEIIR
jgi:glucosamine kinase